MDKTKLATGLLLLGVIFWAATFTLIKQALQFIDVFSFLSVRFIIAGLVLTIIFLPKKIDKKALKYGFYIGLVLSLAITLQTLGLKFTTATNAAFITSLNIIFVAVVVTFLNKALPNKYQISAVVLATLGTLILTYNPATNFNIGDIIVLFSAFSYGAHLVAVSRYVKDFDSKLFSITQMYTVGIMTGIVGLFINKKIIFVSNSTVWVAILFCAIFASAYVYTVQAFLQKYLSEIKVAILYNLEPIFATIIAFLVISEKITPKVIIGGALIFIAMFASEYKMKKKVAELA